MRKYSVDMKKIFGVNHLSGSSCGYNIEDLDATLLTLIDGKLKTILRSMCGWDTL